MLLQALCRISYPLVNSNWSYSPGTPNVGQIRWSLEPCDLEIWWMTFKNNMAPLLCYFKLCGHFVAIEEIKTGVKLGQIRRFLAPCDLEIWRMTLKNNRAPLLSNIKLYVSFHHHMWIQTGVTVRKKLGCDLCDLDLWPLTLTFCMEVTLVLGDNS